MVECIFRSSRASIQSGLRTNGNGKNGLNKHRIVEGAEVKIYIFLLFKKIFIYWNLEVLNCICFRSPWLVSESMPRCTFLWSLANCMHSNYFPWNLSIFNAIDLSLQESKIVTSGDQLTDAEVLAKHKAVSQSLSLKSILGKKRLSKLSGCMHCSVIFTWKAGDKMKWKRG